MSKKSNERTGDAETDAILAEMEQEGEELPTFADAPSDDTEDDESDSGDSKEDDEDAGDEDESEDEDSDDSQEEDEDDESDTDESDAGDDEEGDDEEKDENDEDAGESEEDDETNANVPLWKRNKDLKKQLKDAQEKIADLSKATTEADIDAQIKDFSKKHKVSEEAAKEMITIAASIAAKTAGIDPELKATLDQVLQQGKKQQFWTDQEKSYVRDFRSNVGPLAKRDGKNLAKVQARLQELAFKPENVKKSLVELYLGMYSQDKQAKPARRITSEGNRSHGRVQGAKRAEDLQPEDIETMSDEEFDELSDNLGKESKSRIVRH